LSNRPPRRLSWAAVFALLSALLFAPPALPALPPGFTKELVGGIWNQAVGVTFTADGRMYVWERIGRLWSVDANGVKSAQPVLDISEEVGGWSDYGMLGVVFHPNFLSNGYVYLLYVVDRHHLLHAGTPSYDPATNEYFAATIGRLTRYTLQASTNFQTTDYSSRKVLLGETASTGCPILHQSHGTGSLAFGSDGTLFAACGDGASFFTADVGSAPESYYLDGLADGIITPKQNVGALRCQLLDSHSGKIMRLDPETGDGVPSNPYYDPAAPRSPASRVWALGLRNPYRMVFKPGTGSHEPAEADPGTLYVGDVGWDLWEEMDVIDRPAMNFGWPLYEGIDAQPAYMAARTPNLDAPNPLYGQVVPGVGLCTHQHFDFQDLVHSATLEPSPSFPNPCNPSVQVPASIPKWVHQRPKIDWRHINALSRWTSWLGNNPVTNLLGPTPDPNGKVVLGAQFAGSASTAGIFYTGNQLPAQYLNTYFHGDYTGQWIRNLSFDANDEPLEVRDFDNEAGGVVDIAMNPISGALYYIEWTALLWKITWVGIGNEPPNAVASLDAQYGPSPHTVQFQGSASTDPENGALSYSWDFGDGSPPSTAANPVHVFNAPPGVPTAYTVTLTVTDPTLLTSQATLLVSVNNTPPNVAITSPLDGTEYPVGGPDITYPLSASISDAEQAGGFSCEWVVALHHNTHNHPNPPISGCSPPQLATISTVGCDGNIYFWRVTLRVTDDAGLQTADTSDLLPSCVNDAPVANNDSASVMRGNAVFVAVLGNDHDVEGGIDPSSIQIVSPALHGVATVDPMTGGVSYQNDGSAFVSDGFSYTVRDQEGLLSNTAQVTIQVVSPNPSQVPSLSPGALALTGALLAGIGARGSRRSRSRVSSRSSRR
jgi:glucose/arabinose dehydrogenase